MGAKESADNQFDHFITIDHFDFLISENLILSLYFTDFSIFYYWPFFMSHFENLDH